MSHPRPSSQPATSMHQLVIEGNVQALHEAVSRDPDSVNELNESGLPPLYTAALFRNRRQSISAVARSRGRSFRLCLSRQGDRGRDSAASRSLTWLGQPPGTA